MKQYLLSMYQPDGEPPPPEILDPIMHKLDGLMKELEAAGAWVFTARLSPSSTSTVVRSRDGELFTTDGPYAEGKEHLGGLIVIQAPDLDAALGWARRFTEITTLPMEVRPFVD